MARGDVERANRLGGEGAKQAIPSKVVTRSGTFTVSKSSGGKINLTGNGVKATMKSPTQITQSNMKEVNRTSRMMDHVPTMQKREVNNVKIARNESGLVGREVGKMDHMGGHGLQAGGGGGGIGLGEGGLREQMR